MALQIGELNNGIRQEFLRKGSGDPRFGPGGRRFGESAGHHNGKVAVWLLSIWAVIMAGIAFTVMGVDVAGSVINTVDDVMQYGMDAADNFFDYMASSNAGLAGKLTIGFGVLFVLFNFISFAMKRNAGIESARRQRDNLPPDPHGDGPY